MPRRHGCLALSLDTTLRGERDARRALMALQAAAVRRGNGLCAARYATVFDADRAFTRVHVVCSAYVPLRSAQERV